MNSISPRTANSPACGGAARWRRSKKREAALLQALRGAVDTLCAEAGCAVLWDEPLREARRG